MHQQPSDDETKERIDDSQKVDKPHHHFRLHSATENFLYSTFKKSWEVLMDMKQTRPEMIKELGRAVQHYMNRHEGGESEGKCFEASLFEGRREICRHREHCLSPLHIAAEAGNTLLYQFILAHRNFSLIFRFI